MILLRHFEGLVFAARAVEAIGDGRNGPERTGVLRDVDPFDPGTPVTVRTESGPAIREELQRVMTRDAGVVRSAESLERAAQALASLQPVDVESANLLTVSTALVRAATARRESRGTHTRSDYPDVSSAFLGRLVFTGGAAPEFVALPANEREPSR